MTGRVGLELTSLLQKGFITRGDSFEFADAIAGSHSTNTIDGIKVRTVEDPEPTKVHVWLDFSQPKATIALLDRIHLPIVIGTTGFSENELSRIREYSEKQPVLLSSNMSPGMNLVLSMLQRVPVPPSLGFDVVVSETHHIQKKDSPSGSAISLVETLKNAGQENIEVKSIREGTVKGVHKVSFIGEDEEFSLEHRVFNRSVFAHGALLAAHFLMNNEAGLYSMHDLWNSSEV